jgi:hypothetical protein
MIEIIRELFNNLYNGNLDKNSFFREFLSKTGVNFNEKFCLESIEKASLLKDAESIDTFFQMGLMYGFSTQSVSVLCKLLLLDCHHVHEDIANLLKELKDPISINFLYKATEIQFEYLDYDDTYQFARKCIKAIGAIGGSEAIYRLEQLSKSPIHEIADYALKELNRLV